MFRSCPEFQDIFFMKTSKQMISAIDSAAPKSFSASIVKITRVLSLTACIKVISRLILKSEASILCTKDATLSKRAFLKNHSFQ